MWRTPSSTRTRPAWSMPCSTSWRAISARANSTADRDVARMEAAAAGIRISLRFIRATISANGKWQRHRAAEVGRRIPGELVDGQVIVGHALEKPLHRDLRHQSRHLAAEAEMLAGAKTEMALRAALDIVAIRIGKFPPIAVAG